MAAALFPITAQWWRRNRRGGPSSGAPSTGRKGSGQPWWCGWRRGCCRGHRASGRSRRSSRWRRRWSSEGGRPRTGWSCLHPIHPQIPHFATTMSTIEARITPLSLLMLIFGEKSCSSLQFLFCLLFRFGLRLLLLRFQSIRVEQCFGGFCLADLHLTSTPHGQPSPKHYRNKKKPQSVPHFSFSLYGLSWLGSQLRPSSSKLRTYADFLPSFCLL